MCFDFREKGSLHSKEVAAMIGRLKPGKAAGEDEIRSVMLNALRVMH